MRFLNHRSNDKAPPCHGGGRSWSTKARLGIGALSGIAIAVLAFPFLRPNVIRSDITRHDALAKIVSYFESYARGASGVQPELDANPPPLIAAQEWLSNRGIKSAITTADATDVPAKVSLPAITISGQFELAGPLMVAASSDADGRVFVFDASGVGWWQRWSSLFGDAEELSFLSLQLDSGQRPARLWLPDDGINLGTLTGVGTERRELVVLNPGNSPIHIKSHHFSCGCTTGELESDTIPARGYTRLSIEPVIAAGQQDFGENRVQEALGKWPELRGKHSHLTLHLIGPLQSNKAKDAVGLFDVIQSIDREKIAKAIAEEMAKQGRQLDLFVQVNTGEEPQKAALHRKT